ncbi:MAG: phosphodiester glycosidase family protein [Candidatus Obscuribacterales bacterium]|nr:phosphodiester glycosidase family protein [Candidatus Obscuribacterales bacterium]
MKLFARHLALLAALSQLAMPVSIAAGETIGIGVVGPVPSSPVRAGIPTARKKQVRLTSKAGRKRAPAKKAPAKKVSKNAAAAAKKAAKPLRPPQQELGNMAKLTLAPGVVLKRHRGALNINILDVDLKQADLEVKPVLASDTFNRLDEVRDQAAKVHAIAAINANYFKKDGTPLGTLIMDGEWVSGPIFNRISMGITANGDVFIDTPNLHGTLETSNPEIPSIWVNNINQPRRRGDHLIMYSRRWGGSVTLPAGGTLVAVDASGRVTSKSSKSIGVPYGGFVLSDAHKSDIAKLDVGEYVNLNWQARPERWSSVVHAISGGPCLIRNGKLFVDLKGEHFRKNWTSSTIHARTAAGVTRDKHLILVTVEGPHTLWDVAKLFKELNCVDAMNLDGGGSTTMVVQGDILTRNANHAQRRVAATLAVVPRSASSSTALNRKPLVNPETNLTDLSSTSAPVAEAPLLADPAANALTDKNLKNCTEIVQTPGLEPDIIQQHTAASVQSILEETPAPKSRKKKFRNWMKNFLP